jgi:hypothetical protein
MRRGGFGVYAGLVDGGVHEQLLAEAVSLSSTAEESLVEVSDGEEGRGGRPARRFLNCAGGAVQQCFYRAPGMSTFLRALTHASLQPTGDAGTYSYYARSGDFLALHRDIIACDVAVITCLRDAPEGASGGLLCLYPNRLFEPLSAIRATPSHGACPIRLLTGQTIVFYGGIVPHALLPVDAGQVRIVSVLCYRLP